MAPDPSADQVRSGRLHSQWLTDAGADSPLEVVRHLIGVQAQIPSAAALVVRPRTDRVHAADVARASASGGPLVRTWLMRGTLHLASADDLGWLLTLLAPVVLGKSRRRHAELGLDHAALSRSAELLGSLLEEGPATRAELFAGLAAEGIDPGGQRGIHMIRHAALGGLLVCGPDRGREQTWVRAWPTRDTAVDHDAALAELARRYIASYAPAGPHDLAAWSGLPVSQAKRGWQLVVDSGDRAPFSAGARQHSIRLLPHFDPYLLGYAERDHAVASEHRRAVWTGGGYVVPTVIQDGRVVATWRSEIRGSRLAVTATPFEGGLLDAATASGLDAEIADLGRFLDREVQLALM